jgi:hypothetical protein
MIGGHRCCVSLEIDRQVLNILALSAEDRPCEGQAMQTETIYMYLRDEAVDVWRPVQAENLGDDVYRVFGPVPEGEVWEFSPGSVVRVQIRRLSAGDARVAVSNAAN